MQTFDCLEKYLPAEPRSYQTEVKIALEQVHLWSSPFLEGFSYLCASLEGDFKNFITTKDDK